MVTPTLAPTPNLPDLPSLRSLLHHIAQLDLSPARRRQQSDVYALGLAGQTVIVLTHPDHARHVFQHPHRYPKALHRHQITANDEQRLAQLRLLRPQFHRRRLAALCELMVTTIDRELDAWAQPDSPPLDLFQAMSKVTMEVLTHAVFGPDLPADEYTQLGTALVAMVEHSPGEEGASILRATPSLQPVLACYDQAFDRALALCRQATAVGRDYNCLLTLLLDAVDTRTGLPQSAEQLREELLFDFFVGFENIATALSRAFHLLMAHPPELARLQQEVDEVLAGELPTLEMLSQLGYAGMVLEETLRLHPAVEWLQRRAVADDQIAGQAIPAGALVLLAAKLYQSDPEIWPDPQRFDPERFSATNRTQHHPCAWLPFGGGQRFCLGKDFALMEGKLILALTLQRFDFTPAEG